MNVVERWEEVCEQCVDLLGVSGGYGEQVFEVGVAWAQCTGEQAAERGCVGLDFGIGRVIGCDCYLIVDVQEGTMVWGGELECAGPGGFCEAVLEQR
jgi:hypothetical protein